MTFAKVAEWLGRLVLLLAAVSIVAVIFLTGFGAMHKVGWINSYEWAAGLWTGLATVWLAKVIR